MTYTLFISDIHLDPREPKTTQAFKDTLSGPARKADALYILGDLFEVWIGDDDLNPFHLEIFNALHEFTSSTNIPTYFMSGNRDFLIGRRFAKMTGVKILSDPTVVDLYGKKTILLHGDTLCVNDYKYQNFRRKTHHPLFKPIAYAIPLFLRRKIAKKMRAKSFEHYHVTDDTLMDACPKEIERVMQEHKADLMIHGHTHRPKIHDNNRIVLGSWHKKSSLLYIAPDKDPVLE
jgi:UDP-2,3-diacylglucosamine hydrolase